jgi:hypothetical protein
MQNFDKKIKNQEQYVMQTAWQTSINAVLLRPYFCQHL